MDELIFPQPSPAPLILPRRLSTHGGGAGADHRHKGRRLHIQQQQPLHSPSEDKESDSQSRDNQFLGGNSLTHCFYYPTGRYPPNPNTHSTSPGDIANPPAIFSFGNDKGMEGFVNPPVDSVDTSYQPAQTTARRHSVATGSPWATIPPRHALHMPVMKVNPEIWRSENHQREIHRLMREGREEEVMKRRDIQSVMDTISDDDEEKDMSGVVLTTDLGGFREAEEKEKTRIQEEVRQEWARQVEYQNIQWRAQEYQRRRSWPNLLDQQQPMSSGQPRPPLHQGVMQRIPNQLPAPGLQRRSSFGRLDGSISGPPGGYTRGSGQFTSYR